MLVHVVLLVLLGQGARSKEKRMDVRAQAAYAEVKNEE